MLNLKIVSLSLALTAAVSFLVCVLWGLFLPDAVHMHGFLESVLPGFKWLSLGSFALGLVESALFGVYFGVVYVLIHNALRKRINANSPA